MESTVIPQLFAGKGRDDSVRVWTVGCATGEEAYSIAMLLLEYAEELAAPPTIQVFASDLGKGALDFAREGCYPAAIAVDITEARLARFFTKDNSHYRVRPELREAILFTQHNLLQDPPFSKLDLIICRNLLIYIQRDLQEKIFETFYYALRHEGRGRTDGRGFLFLGNAESADGASDLFDTLDKRHRLYQRRPQGAAQILPSLPLLPQLSRQPPLAPESPRTPQPPPSEEHRRLIEAVAPPSLLVDRENNVLHLSATAGRYLLPPGGTPTVDVLKLVRPELQGELRTALFHAFTQGKAVATRPIPVRFNGAPHPVYLMVRPHQLADDQVRALVIFLEDETPVTDEPTDASSVADDTARQQVEAELRHTQTRLQTMREEYETTVEELRAANEELQSTNEEYKSTLEELETSKEELQSINEELQTINQELKNKVEEVTQTQGDMQNLFAATDIATLFLDRELQVKRYTPRAADLFNLMPTDRGRPIAHLRTNLHYNELEADARRVLAHLTPVEREVSSQDGHWFLARVRPYRTMEDRIDGVVISFVDITANKENELALQAAKEYAESIVHTIPDALLVLTPDLRVQTANDAFYAIFQVDPATTEGRLIYDLGNGQWHIPALRTLLEEILPQNNIFTGYEVDHEFDGIGRRVMLLNGRRLDHVQLILLAMTDITDRKRFEQRQAFLLQFSDVLRPLAAAAEIYAAVTHTTLNFFDADRCYYCELVDGNAIIERDASRAALPSVAGLYPLSDFPIFKAVVDVGRPFVVHDAHTTDLLDETLRRLCVELQVISFIDVPIIKEGRPVGILCVTQGTPRNWTQFEIEMAEEIAERVWSAVERARTEEALRHSEERFRTLVAKGADMITISDRAGYLRYASPTTERVTGYTPEEFMQQHPFDSVHPADRPLCEEALQQLLVTPGLTLELQHRFRHKDGTWRWLEGSFTSLYHDPIIGGLVANVRDITARKETEAALQHLNTTLEQQVDTRTAQVQALASSLTIAEQEERRRISQILHDDLQQLLYGIQMRAMAIVQGLGQEEQATMMAYAREIYARLGDAIRTTRQLTVDLSPPILQGEGLHEMLRWLTRNMQEVHNLTVDLREDQPCWIDDADMRVLLFQSVRELLFNVVKHAGVDQATVELNTHTADECVIRIQDEGRGFDVAAAAAQAGGGFGLFSVRERLALFGGRMEIDSAPNQGTRILLYIPISSATPEA
ncbi:MAG: CheR family methyltransferase [Caldilineaceae bacterium]